jgi:hypothetical protein
MSSGPSSEEAPEPPFELELELERALAALAAELPAHLRAFARAHAAGAPMPPAPAVVRRPSLAALARRAAAYPTLAARGLALLRLAVPVVVESEPAVARARAAAPSWTGLAVLAAAREAASRARFGLGFVELAHALHGAPPAGPGPFAGAPPVGPGPREAYEPPAGWTAPDPAVGAIGPAEIEAVWRELARRHGAAGRLQLLASAAARPRAFIVEPGREVIAVVPARVETPAARFAVLHELGHALAGLAAPSALPRAVDEAAASYAARAMEAPAHPWHSALAAPARARRRALAAILDGIERAGGPVPSDAARPPWALWHDPGAQASYVRAEELAEAWVEGGEAAFARGLAGEAAAIDGAAVAAVLGAGRP